MYEINLKSNRIVNFICKTNNIITTLFSLIIMHHKCITTFGFFFFSFSLYNLLQYCYRSEIFDLSRYWADLVTSNIRKPSAVLQRTIFQVSMDFFRFLLKFCGNLSGSMGFYQARWTLLGFPMTLPNSEAISCTPWSLNSGFGRPLVT